LRAIFQLGKLDFFDGRPPARLWRAVELARQAGALVELAWAEETLAIALTLQGQPAAALEVLDVAIPRARELHLDQLGYLLTARAGALSFVQVDKTVEDLFAEAESVASAPEIRLMQLALRADIAVHSGRFDEALTHLKHADQMVSAMPGAAPVDSGGLLAWVYIALGQHDDAKATLSRTAVIPDLARWYPRPVLVKAGRALLEGDAAGVDAAIAAARGPLPFSIAMMRVIGAIVLDGATRIRWLREALDIYEGTGATAYRGRARQLLRDAGGPVPRRRPAPDAIPEGLARHGVTAREADVLRLLGGGLSNADIAAQLFVSVRTVETHVSSLLGKLNVRSRGQLIALCANLEWNVN
jgi:ATP/maltotriose-dependent transcriptional regulator MalT